MIPKTAGREQELVALDGRATASDEITRLRGQIARLEEELRAERASAAALYSQLTVLSRQLDAASEPTPRGAGRLLRRKA
jgi:predicted  nucleic acid-binding Zn-ribbon protein